MRRRAWIPVTVLLGLWALGGSATASPPADWTTYGFSPSRSGFNPSETALNTSQARTLRKLWTADLGGYINTQPLVAYGVQVGGSPRDLVFAGTDSGRFEAVDAATGAPVWSRDLGAANVPECQFTYGITDTPVLDRSRGSVYLVDGTGETYDLDLATGATKRHWSIGINTTHEHVWSALTLVRGRLYVPVGGTCDIEPYHGRVLAYDPATGTRVARWYVTPPNGPNGGGIWAWGGVSADPARNVLYTATGNSFPIPKHEHKVYSEHVVRLTRDLHVSASHDPSANGVDADFGSTPLLYQAKNCPRQLAVGNKYGEFFVYNRSRIGKGPVQHISLGGSGDGNHALLGVAAFWGAKRLIYVANPVNRGKFKAGIVAFRVTDRCRLKRAWQAKGPGELTSSPTVANGVLYYGTGKNKRLLALNASNGKPLWSSGSTIGARIQNAPTVSGGTVFVGAWNGLLYAFRPSAARFSSYPARRRAADG